MTFKKQRRPSEPAQHLPVRPGRDKSVGDSDAAIMRYCATLAAAGIRLAEAIQRGDDVETVKIKNSILEMVQKSQAEVVADYRQARLDLGGKA